jgi:hypothetical protein
VSDIGFKIDDKQLQEALKALEARQAAVNATVAKFGPLGSKAYTQVEAAAKRAANGPSEWTKALQANTAALGDLRGKINLGAESLGKLGGALSLVSPELAVVAQGLQKVTGLASAGAAGSQVLGGAMTAVATAAVGVGLAVAPLIGLYSDLADAQEQAKASEEARANAMNRNIEFTERVAKAQRAALDAVKGDEERERIKVTEAWTTALEEELKPLREEYAILEKIAGNSPKAVEARKRMNELVEEQIELEKKASLGADADLVALDIARDRADAEDHLADKLKDREKAEKDAGKAAEDAAKEALAYLEKEEKAEREFWERHGQSLADADAASAASNQKELDDFNEMLKEKGKADAKALDEAEEKHNEYVETVKGSAKSAYDDVTSAASNYLDQIASNQSDTISALQSAIEKAEENGQTAKANRLKKDLQKEQEAAVKVFELRQAAAAGQATLSFAEALMTAATLPPPADIIKGLAATAAYGLSLATINSEQPPTFTDTPPGGFRMGPGNNTVQGSPDDTAILFRDPLEGVAQSLEILARRQAPTSTAAPSRRPLLGPQLARTPVARLLTRDVERVTRGRIG